MVPHRGFVPSINGPRDERQTAVPAHLSSGMSASVLYTACVSYFLVAFRLCAAATSSRHKLRPKLRQRARHPGPPNGSQDAPNAPHRLELLVCGPPPTLLPSMASSPVCPRRTKITPGVGCVASFISSTDGLPEGVLVDPDGILCGGNRGMRLVLLEAAQGTATLQTRGRTEKKGQRSGDFGKRKAKLIQCPPRVFI